jgi:serine/threonine-protein kinase
VKICPLCHELRPDEATFCTADGGLLGKVTDPLLGRTIAARYRIIRRLGAGGMANVYLARHLIIERQSAIKVLRHDLALDPSSRERFLREARAVNRINHPNIVEITDYGEFEGMAYLVMEYVEGDSLLAALKRGPLPWPRAVHLASQVVSALGRAHQMGVIHRDLKPENVILVGPSHRAGTREEQVKLTDFGIARIVDLPRLTFSEQMFGTPGYIAPEYVEGAPVDARADLYAVGVVLYEMMTGVLPYDARTQADKLVKPLSSPPIPPGQRVAGLPTELEALVLRLLARFPDDRPRDAFVVVDALSDILRRYASPSLRPPKAEASEAKLMATSGAPPTSSPTLVELRATAVPPLGLAIAIEVPVRAGLVLGPPPSEPPTVALPLRAKERGEQGTVTANVARMPTGEMTMHWSRALLELETSIQARAKERGGTFAADRAGELAGVARQMIPRVERAQQVVGEAQGRLDRLEAEARDFRANLGHAIDVLVHDRSRERAHLEALSARHSRLADAVTSVAPESIDTRTWENAALEAELERGTRVEVDLTFQIDQLQKRLDAENEEFERQLVATSGLLEGSLSALRRLTNELVRTMDEAAVILGGDRVSRTSVAPA